ncbi:MAG: homoserine dehydrogenase [Ruminococcaceae bacterium]|nr:homoserine dehydrogenase [Oscillospiraceae bacterium]
MFKIAILGGGVVGSGVADILIDKSKALSERFHKDVSLAYILDIRDMTGTKYEPYYTNDKEVVFSDDDVKLIVVTIGGLDLAADFCRRALKSGRHVVTSNKEVVAAVGRELTLLADENNVRFLYEASSGGGIPIIRPLNLCLASNDIYEINGILNGTTNYILTCMYQDRLSFDVALKNAQAAGYAEANPSADVDGYDAARKIAILSSISYGKFVDYNDVKCTGIRDVIYDDHEFAASAGYAIKLIAGSRNTDKGVTCTVEPKLVPKSNMLASVNSVYNAVLVKGSYTGDTLMYGQGAGKLPTASAVVGDIIDILTDANKQALPGFVHNNAVVIEDTEACDKYYVRINVSYDNESDDIKDAVIKCFGDKALFLGASLSNHSIVAFITEKCTAADFTAKLDAFCDITGAKAEYKLKVID